MSRWGSSVKPWQTTEEVRRGERQRRAAVAETMLAEKLTPPVAAAVQVDDPEVFDINEYKALVAELGVDDSAVRNYELRQFFAAEGIQVFDYQKVVAFMDAKTKDERKAHKIEALEWKWKPISEKYPDVSKTPNAPASNRWITGGIITFTMPGGEEVLATPTRSTRAYARAIPHAVLLTVKKIKDKFGDAVHFYASDYEVRNPDPFLMVTGPGLDFYVIERWDEPTFRS